MNKEDLRRQILGHLQAELDTQIKAAHLAHDEATNEESRAESKYDTHSQEAAYLAEGQARLANEATESIRLFQSIPLPSFNLEDPIALGALVELTAADRSTWYLLGPRAGGLELKLPQGATALLITHQSPMGRQLLGKSVGQQVQGVGRDKSLHLIRQVL
jgi:transcription elongation GreA/GreB family factor